MSIAENDLAHWRTWIGREEVRREVLDAEALRRFAAAIGESLEVETDQPSLAHWAFFLPIAAADQIGPDGHPKRGGFMPPITLPRRMFAAGRMEFGAALALGQPATRRSIIRDLQYKSGRSGDLILLEVEHTIEQAGEVRVTERQTIVYRDAGAATPAIVAADVPPAPDDAIWNPTSVDLFRFSAVTFNSHRIHYDLPYATAEEFYPGLVVHGPFTATRLFGHARRHGPRPHTYAFRAVAPMFCGAPIVLREVSPGQLAAIRADGAEAMVAGVEY
ncbi:3-methylfumaryl-CoA hydratase [Novosphingobium sp. SG751A]|uniref:FAS1-like dehydratase domain-containing protein n=1 Tax=Novosphingobium sp. SG751A TaxID=2587000 RepID=UPI0015541722|nr:MaoC family dehydratase N-terminal domain-containing protein [Novosphingobium sp. SG751A]NOW48196.1 3-methylfumaryl-CoA hydratase [Novosphingobium sp. SG751A]